MRLPPNLCGFFRVWENCAGRIVYDQSRSWSRTGRSHEDHLYTVWIGCDIAQMCPYRTRNTVFRVRIRKKNLINIFLPLPGVRYQ